MCIVWNVKTTEVVGDNSVDAIQTAGATVKKEH